MLDEDRLKQVLASMLGVPLEMIQPDCSVDTIPNWDSLRHMNLVLALEQEFQVTVPDEEAANITSYALIKLVLNELLEGA